MVGIGFCSVCEIRIFKDDKLNKDYYMSGKDKVCKDCMDEMHKCQQCGLNQPYCNECV